MQPHDLSFDPHDPYFPVPGASGLTWAVQVFTLDNVYGVASQSASSVTEDDAVDVTVRSLTWGGGSFSSTGTVQASVQLHEGSLAWSIQATHPEPIKSIKLLLRGVSDTLAHSGWWHATSDTSVPARVATPQGAVQYDYPNAGEWQTPWVAASAESEAITVAVRDTGVHAIRFFAHTPPWAEGATVVEVICEQDARHFNGSFTTPAIRVHPDIAPDEVENDFESHLTFVEEHRGLTRWEERTDVPAWARGIRLVAALHGQHWTGKIFNTYDDMADALRFLAAEIAGEEILAYLPGWEGRYYWQYPYFAPADALGGHDGFQRLADTARRLGVRLMPMFGAHGANARIYPEWADATFLNTTGRYPVLLNKPDWDGDRAGEDDQVFLNTAHPGFQELLVDQVSYMVNTYGIDVAYFDTTGAWFNDPRHNLIDGYHRLKRTLHDRHPDLLITGEAWTDALLSVFPINLTWLGASTPFRFPQVLSRYGRAIQHILEGAPGLGSTGVYEGGYLPANRSPMSPGHIASLSVVDNTIRDHGEDVRQILRSLLPSHSSNSPH